MNISPEQIGEFLKLNPDYFRDHPDLLAEIHVPSPHGGAIVSLGERQVAVLRDKTRGLEAKLREFIQFAEENDAIGDKLHQLSLGLMRARSLTAALQSLYLNLGDNFAVPHVAVRLWAAHGPDLLDAIPDQPEFARVSPEVKVLMAGLTQPQCGSQADGEIRAWFGESGLHLKSFALAPLRDGDLEGLMVLASEDPKRFYPEMGTLYLTWLAELTGASLARYL